uniref:Complement C5 n=1 Tax=Sphenodon punctatus TaxID=8508 RepID=A0A8D0HUV9_SPHPU
MNILRIFLILTFCGRSRSQEQTYVIAAPRMFRVGASEKVVIQAFGYEQEFPVSISIKSFPDKQRSYSSEQLQLSPANKFQGSVTLTVQPKDLPNAAKLLEVYLEATSPHFTRDKKIPVTYDNGFLFIQTDKPIYTPDQSVKIRVYSLNEELKPARRPTALTFVDPEGVAVDIIEEDDFTGVVSFPDFKIPSNPKYGIWKIKAKYQKDFTTSAEARFEVKDYAMPGFSVTIEPEKNFISSDKFEEFKITIKASYFYNKRVDQAQVFARFGIIEGTEKTMMPRALRLMVNGIAEVSFNSKAAVSDINRQSLEELDGAYLYIAVSVLESTGGQSEESEFAGVRYVLSPYKLTLIATPLFVKPGLPYHIKVQVKDTLDQPVANIPVVLTASSFDEQMAESELVRGDSSVRSVNDGTSLFVLNIPPTTKILEFRVKTSDTSLPEENQATGSYEAKAYESLSQSYLYIDWDSHYQQLRVGNYLNVAVYPRSHYIHKIHHYSYLILSKGKIVTFGTQARIKDSNFEHLNLQITQEMVPSARLLVYYIVTGEGSAELVADSVWINVEQKCANSLKLSRKEGPYKPGDVVSLSMNTQLRSFAALSSMDKAIYGVTGARKRPMERVLLDLEKNDFGCGAGGGQNNVDVFRLAGLTFLTNANAEDSKGADEACKAIVRSTRATFSEEIQKKCCLSGVEAYPISETCSDRSKRIKAQQRCIDAFRACCELATKLRQTESHKNLILARMGTLEPCMDEPQIRSYFPESWLWEVHEYYYYVLGICVADAVQAQVLKDVFLSVQIPYSVVRGEQIELTGSVYNYLGSRMKFCSKISVGPGICLFGGSAAKQQGVQSSQCSRRYLNSFSVTRVAFRILPLELGLHTINFTLLAERNSEVVVKTLRVVVRTSSSRCTIYIFSTIGSMKKRQEFRYRIPPNLVPKTRVDRTVSVKGHLMGEVIATVLKPDGVRRLVTLPKGSAEAELMSVVPVFYVFHYLEKADRWDILGPEQLTSRVNLRRQMKEGIISILSFRNQDASYSMWKGGEPSTWLTAFALRIFGQVSLYIPLDKNPVCNSLVWMVDSCQMGDGSFREISSYEPIKLQGTLPKEAKEKTLYLTAFSVIALEKAIHICPLQKIQDAKNKAKDYLMKNFRTAQSTFTLAITAYALAITDSNHPDARSVFSMLKKEAQVRGSPPIYRFWKETFMKLDQSIPTTSTSRIVETTAYALLTTLINGDQNYANPVVKWLSEQQRYGGGFYSTQDTINALEALTEYSLLIKRLSLDMDVKVAYKNHGDLHRYSLTESNYIGEPVEVSGLLSEREPQSGSSHAVMDIALLSGLEPNSEDLCILANGVDQLITSYEVKDGHVIVQIESIPADKFLCVGFRIVEMFRVGMQSPGTFAVYEYHTTYVPSFSLNTAECSQMQSRLDLSITANSRTDAACRKDIAYDITLSPSAAGEAFAQKNNEITFVKKKTCAAVEMTPGEYYLIMGKEALRIRVGFSFRYQYPLDSMTWIEFWPSNSACASCQEFVEVLEEFAEDLFISGC